MSFISTLLCLTKGGFISKHLTPRRYHHRHQFIESVISTARRQQNHPITATISSSADFSSTERSIMDQQTTTTNNKEMSSSSSNLIKNQVMAKIVSMNELSQCGQRLRDGHLVSFPTETVYGLGCHALDSSAIQKVFAAKERPHSDPLIIHVLESKDALKLWDNHNDDNVQCLKQLMQSFWPGPLTLVAKAAPCVPPLVMANTGFVACRSPSHSVARRLLQEAGIPIAAPSANKFGHVSPTRSQHVFDDLKFENVWILDNNSQQQDDEEPICQVGVESTVAKLDGTTLVVLRQGAISANDIQHCLEQAGLDSIFSVTSQTKRMTSETQVNVAPGQCIRHYSPNIPSFVLSEEKRQLSERDRDILQTAVLVDFGSQLAHWSEYCLAYRDLSPQGDASEAARAVFETLRWAEQVEGAKQIFFANIVATSSNDALKLAVLDRLTRAANGKNVDSLEDL